MVALAVFTDPHRAMDRLASTAVPFYERGGGRGWAPILWWPAQKRHRLSTIGGAAGQLGKIVSMAAHRYLRVASVAELFGVNVSKVIGWIRRGELRAVNIAARTSKRPRWRISSEAIEQFEHARSSVPSPPAARPHHKRGETVIPFV